MRSRCRRTPSSVVTRTELMSGREGRCGTGGGVPNRTIHMDTTLPFGRLKRLRQLFPDCAQPPAACNSGREGPHKSAPRYGRPTREPLRRTVGGPARQVLNLSGPDRPAVSHGGPAPEGRPAVCRERTMIGRRCRLSRPPRPVTVDSGWPAGRFKSLSPGCPRCRAGPVGVVLSSQLCLVELPNSCTRLPTDRRASPRQADRFIVPTCRRSP